MLATQNCKQYREGCFYATPEDNFILGSSFFLLPLVIQEKTQSQVSSQTETQTVPPSPKKEEGG